jgi:pyruvate formate lyase activating enzyme
MYIKGCNFNCPYCHNPDLVRPFGLILDEDGVLNFLKARRKNLDGVVISGGEPCLAADLDEFIKTIKGLGYQVKLDTNGSRPEVVKNLLEKHLVDYVALDLKADPADYPLDLGPKKDTSMVLETISVLKRLGKPHEYRTTVVRPFVTRESIVAIAKAAQGQWPLYLQVFRKQRVLKAEFFESYPEQANGDELRELKRLASEYLPTIIRSEI